MPLTNTHRRRRIRVLILIQLFDGPDQYGAVIRFANAGRGKIVVRKSKEIEWVALLPGKGPGPPPLVKTKAGQSERQFARSGP